MAYIDRKVAIKTAVENYKSSNQFDVLEMIEAMEAIPTADVAEVKHGKWIDNKIPNSILDECSECGFSCGAYTFNYCPMCGAKMDGKEDT